MSDTGELLLLFTAGGQAELHEDGELVWSSDSDDEWREDHEDEFIQPSESADVLNFLVDEGWLEQSERGQVEIEVESHTAASLAAAGADDGEGEDDDTEH